MSVRMRHTSGHTGNRRSHHAIKEPRLSSCADCGSAHLRHRVCVNCGRYRGRMVIDVAAKAIKKEKKAKAKQQEAKREQEEVKASDAEEKEEVAKPLDPAELSKR